MKQKKGHQKGSQYKNRNSSGTDDNSTTVACIDHEQAVIDICLSHFGESPPVERLSSKLGSWLRFGSKKNLAAKLSHSDGGGYGYIIKDHLSGEVVKGFTDNLKDLPALSPTELSKLKAKRKRAEQERIKKAQLKADRLSRRVKRVWDQAIKPDQLGEVFPYLVKKGEPVPRNVRFYRSTKRLLMLVPMICPFKGLRSLQLIDITGFKRPLLGTATKGLMMAISEQPLANPSVLWVCEGYATGLSLFAETHEPVIVAFTCGNLENVVEKLVRRYPSAVIKICADNDLSTFEKRGFNPGVDAAKKVQETFPQVEVLIPEFPAGAVGLSDFNDLRQYVISHPAKEVEL